MKPIFINTAKQESDLYKYYFNLKSDSIDFGNLYVYLPKSKIMNSLSIKKIVERIKQKLEPEYSYLGINNFDKSGEIPTYTVKIKKKTKEEIINEYHKDIVKLSKQTGRGLSKKKRKRYKIKSRKR